MFANRNATLMIPVSDLTRAKRWYQDKLGLAPSEDLGEMGARYEFAGANAFMYPTSFAGTAQNTMMSFDCPDLVADMAALRARGVKFEDYDFPGLKTENGLAEFDGLKNAWAKDSEGNILAFVEGM